MISFSQDCNPVGQPIQIQIFESNSQLQCYKILVRQLPQVSRLVMLSNNQQFLITTDPILQCLAPFHLRRLSSRVTGTSFRLADYNLLLLWAFKLSKSYFWKIQLIQSMGSTCCKRAFKRPSSSSLTLIPCEDYSEDEKNEEHSASKCNTYQITTRPFPTTSTLITSSLRNESDSLYWSQGRIKGILRLPGAQGTKKAVQFQDEVKINEAIQLSPMQSLPASPIKTARLTKLSEILLATQQRRPKSPVHLISVSQ